MSALQGTETGRSIDDCTMYWKNCAKMMTGKFKKTLRANLDTDK